jgi:hypothetical protein
MKDPLHFQPENESQSGVRSGNLARSVNKREDALFLGPHTAAEDLLEIIMRRYERFRDLNDTSSSRSRWLNPR